MGSYPTANYTSGLDDAEKQAIIAQQLLRYKTIGLFIKNYLNTDAKRKLRVSRSGYTYNNQDDGAAMFFVIVKMVRPDTCAGCSDIKYNM